MTTQNPANVSFVVTNDWGDGFTADLTIRNTGTTPINGWTLAFNAPYAIDQAWSSTLTKLPDGRYSVSPLSWNTTIPAGGSISFGYRGTKAAGTVAQAPTNYTLNGMALSTGTTTSTPTVLPDLSISDATIAEGGLNTNGQASALFTVKLSQASTSPVTVGYATQNGTAIAGQDFTATQGTLTFAAGETSKTIAVPILNDTAVESTESFSVVLSNATQAKIIDTTGVGTITDNDAVAPVLPDLVISDATLTEGALNANGASSALFKVSLSKASTSQVTVDYLTQGGTAIAGQDFTAAQGKLTFAPGETTKTIAVPITNDTLVEPSESFNVVLSNASQAKILDATGVGTIVDNDQPAATASPFSVEFKVTGDWGTTFTSDLVIRNTGTTPINGWTLTFKAPYTIDQNWNSTLTKLPDGRYSVTPASWNTTIPAGGTVSFGYRGLKAAGTTATAPTDYQLNGISLSNPGTVSTPTLPDLTVSDATLTEGALNTNGASSALFTVKLSQASTSPVTVGYTTQNGTATAGQDFTAMQGTLTFAAGETSKTIAVPILNDTSVESTETFNLVLSNATQAKILDGLGVGTILDNDAVTSTPTLPSLSIGNATLAEGALNASGAASTLFTVTLSKASTSPVTVGYATQNGTAIAGQDFTATQGTLTFAAGQTSKTIAVPIINDTSVESTETFKLVLSNATQATILNGQGTGTILDNDTVSTTPSTGKFNYAEALQKSFLFYEAQRSGDLPASNRIEWRGDSALKDGSDVGRDLTGGYYDAGDMVKFNFPMAASLTMLSWGVREYRGAYAKVGQLDEALNTIRWGTDYLMRCNVTDANGTKEFWGQVGSGHTDHASWGSPESMTMPRPSFKIDRQKPGSDLAGEAAAALASASIVFRQTDAAYADKLLTNAMQLYTFADTYRGKYSDAITDVQSFYNSWSGYQDELAWGAAWIHEALEAAGKTDTVYIAKAEAAYTGITANLSWDNKSAGVGVLLAQDTGNSRYRGDVEKFLNSWLPGGGGVSYTSGGLAWGGEWGSLRTAANMAFVAGVYGDTVTDPLGKYDAFSRRQIDYILGDNPRNSSYVVGFGNNSPVNPHHRAASGTDWGGYSGPQPNAHILYGALVGGPKALNDFAYQDLRTDYIANEVATDYNAAFTGAMARMVGKFGGVPLTDSQLDALPGIAVPTAPAI